MDQLYAMQLHVQIINLMVRFDTTILGWPSLANLVNSKKTCWNHVESTRPGLTSCRSNMHTTWSLAHEVLNIRKLHLHLAMAAIPWNLCASIPASPWPSSSLLFPKVQKPPACQQLPIRNRVRPYTLPLPLFSCLGEQKLAQLRFFVSACGSISSSKFHFLRHASFPDLAIVFWSDASLNPIHLHIPSSCGKSLSTSLFTKITSLLVTEMLDGCSPSSQD